LGAVQEPGLLKKQLKRGWGRPRRYSLKLSGKAINAQKSENYGKDFEKLASKGRERKHRGASNLSGGRTEGRGKATLDFKRKK